MEKATIQLDQFIAEFAQNFDLPATHGLSAATRFRDMDEWSSLQALVVVSDFAENYGIFITSDELMKSETIRDLFELVQYKIQT